MHLHTPSINVIEPRGLPVREVAYCRRAASDLVESRTTHQRYDAVGRLTEQRDPRLFALAQTGATLPPNLLTLHSLSGQTLCSDSVDAGWQLGLPGAAGQALEVWDQRRWHRRIEHDSSLRPVAIFEHFAGDAERCAERITWGRSSANDALHNRIGQPVRQDDPAGTRLLPEYGLSGVVLAEVRHFLDSLDPPDWPASEAERNALLEPGVGARSAWYFAATGEALSQTDAKGHVRQFAHDRTGQLRDIRLQRAGQTVAEVLVSAIEYNASAQVLRELAGNGVQTFSTYGPADGNLLTLANQAPDGVFLQNLSYRYDPVGNIIEIVDGALPIQHFANQRIDPARRFEYDTLYQLIKATGWETAKPSFGPALPEWQSFGPPDASRWCNYSETYRYDSSGNLLERVHFGAVNDTLVMRVAEHSNRSIQDRSGADLEESFDPRGNLLVLQPGQGLVWNGRNELAQVTQVARASSANDVERYIYDAEGARLRKWRRASAKSIAHAIEVRYLPGLELRTNSASKEQLHVLSVQAGRCTVRLLYWEDQPPDGVENAQLRYCFDEHLGSSAFEVDAQAKPISQEVYYPFGGTAWLAGRNEVESSYKTIRYSGKERDVTGLYYYGARYYAPWSHRWLNPDPVGDIDGLNVYRYVRNNPIVYVDHHGNFPFVRGVLDYWIEQRAGIRQMVQARGLRSIEDQSPEIAKILIDALSIARDKINDTITVLEGAVLDKRYERLISKVFGSIDSDQRKTLIQGYRETLSNLEHVIESEGKIVGFVGAGVHESVVAMVILDDRRKKIYFNFPAVESSTPELISHEVIHELSHQSNVFSSKDFWYLIPSEKEFENASVISGGESYDKTLHVAMERKSNEVISAIKVDEDNLKITPGHFIPETRRADMSSALERFNNTSWLRTQMALKNADTLAFFAGKVSRLFNSR